MSNVNVLMLSKPAAEERFIWLYDDDEASTAALMQQLGRLASDPESPVTWYDAAVLSQRVRLKRNSKQEANSPATAYVSGVCPRAEHI